MLAIYIVLAILLLICALDWKKGVFVIILVGFLQDAIRKYDPNESVYFTVLIVPYVIVTLFGLFSDKNRIRAKDILNYYPKLKLPIIVFGIVICVQAIHAYLATSSIAILGIGLLAYFAPLMTLMLSFNYAVLVGEVRKFIRFYVLLGSVFLFGVLLEAAGVEWSALGNVGTPLYIYTEKVVVLTAGFLRAAETSAWHGAFIVMLCAILYVTSKRLISRFFWLTIGLVTILEVFLTGRRKALFQIAIFVVFSILIGLVMNKRFAKTYIMPTVLGIIAIVLAVTFLPLENIFTDFDAFMSRAGEHKRSPFERVWAMTIGSFSNVIQHNSIFGSGVGLGSQGAQHFVGMKTGGSSESGFGKVLAEVGIIGVVVMGWVLSIMYSYMVKIVNYVHGDPYYERLSIGLIAILLANGINFVAAHQVYGDPFVILTIGFVVGFIIALPILLNNENPDLLYEIERIQTSIDENNAKEALIKQT